MPLLPPFLFMRHGESDWNVERLCIGRTDRALTERGRRQAQDAKATLRALAPSAVFTSPLQRASDTAAIATAGLNLEITEVDDLAEVCVGVLEGTYEGDTPGALLRDWLEGAPVEGAETYLKFKARVQRGLIFCLSKPSTDPVLIVSHSAVFSALCDLLTLPSARIRHCEPFVVAPTL